MPAVCVRIAMALLSNHHLPAPKRQKIKLKTALAMNSIGLKVRFETPPGAFWILLPLLSASSIAHWHGQERGVTSKWTYCQRSEPSRHEQAPALSEAGNISIAPSLMRSHAGWHRYPKDESMNKIISQAEAAAFKKATFPESLTLWQKRVASLVGNPELPKTRAAREKLLQDLKQAMLPAGAEFVAMVLMRLQAHYWRPDFSPAQAKALYADFFEDLAHLPPDILEDAIRIYRRDPDEAYFPHPGALLGRAAPLIEERRRAISRLGRALKESAREAELTRTPEEIARVRAAVASLLKELSAPR